MRVKHGVVLREPQHYRRLFDGCVYFGWEAPTPTAFHEAIASLAATLSDGAISLRYSPSQGFCVAPKALDPRLLEYQQQGFSLIPYPEPFPSDYQGYAGAKTSDRTYYDRAMAFAAAQGLPEVLLLQSDGYVVEGYRTNLFAVIDGVLTTPDSPLAVRGTMQAWWMEEAAKQGTPVVMRPIHQDELMDATEIFMTNALVERWPVRDYNGRKVTVTR